MKKLAVAVLVISLITASAMAQDSESDSSNRTLSNQDVLNHLVGKWHTTYEWPNMGEFTEKVEYSWSEDGNHVVMDMEVIQDGEVIDTSNGWVKVDPEHGIIHMEANSESTGETVTGRETKREGMHLWAKGYGGTMMPEYKVKMDFSSKDELTTVWYVPDGENWKTLMELTYNRIK